MENTKENRKKNGHYLILAILFTVPRDVGKTLGEASINEIARRVPYDVSPTAGK